MDIVPAEGYTQRRTSPRNTIYRERTSQSSDRIDRGDHYRGEIPAKRLIFRRSIRGRYLTWRSVTYRLRVIAGHSTDRTKVLQITTFMSMRVTRAVLCEVLPGRLAPLPSPQFSRID